MKKQLTLFVLIISVLTTPAVWANDQLNVKKSCIYNLIQRVGICTFVSAGELMGIAKERPLNSIHRGQKICYYSTTTIEKIRHDSLQVFLCNGASPVLQDPQCYKPIKPGETLIVTGILSQNSTKHLLDEKCYLACNNS